ncbi:hypothetical protein BOX15_Mlig020023g2, partial [Macrostomum lignano]
NSNTYALASMKRSGLPRPQQSDANTRRSRPHGTLTERKSSFLPSSVATPGKRQTEKDTRNLKDRTWQKAVVIRAQSFIEVVGLQALCTSSLKPGSIWTLKEIYNVLEGFVSGVIDLGQSSSFSSIPADSKQRAEQLYNKIEYLGYPYVLSKQVLSSPNTPHNWPLVLGLIDYLCDKLDERKDGAAQYQRMLQRPGECGASLGDTLHAMEEGYAFFLQHGKDGGHFVDRLVQPSLIRKRRDLAQAEEKARLAAEEARVWKERAVPAQRLQQELQELQERFARAEQEADRLRERRSQLESELPLKEAELAAGRTQIDRLRDECEQLSERIRAQPVSQAQVMSIRGDIKELESYIGRLDETLANTEQAIWASETQLSADHDKLSQACNQVNVRLAHLGLPQRAVPELNDDAHQSNQAIEPAVKRHLAYLADQISEANRKREEARKRLDSIIDAVETQEARLATINSMIEAEKASKRRSEEAKLQELSASVDAATKQLASAEAACDRQQERLARAVRRERDAASRLSVFEAELSRNLASAIDAVKQAGSMEIEIVARRAELDSDRRRLSDRLAELTRRCSHQLVSIVSDIVATNNTNLMAALLPRIQELHDQHRGGVVGDNDNVGDGDDAELLAAICCVSDKNPELEKSSSNGNDDGEN